MTISSELNGHEKENRPIGVPMGGFRWMTNAYVTMWKPRERHARTADVVGVEPRAMTAPSPSFVYVPYDRASVGDCPTNYSHRI